jgi:spore coat protein U-like protein
MLPRAAPFESGDATMTVRNASMLTTHRRSCARAVHPITGLAFAACAALAACTNAPPSSKAFVLASLAASQDPNHNNLCNFNSARSVLQIGTNTGTDPTRVSDGATQMGAATVNVTCTVTGSFDVNLTASLGGVQGGSLIISGHVDGASGGQNIHASLTSPSSGGTFSQDNNMCTIAFTYGGAPVPQTPPIAPGRIWAHLSCPAMKNGSGQFVHLMDGTTVPETCDGEVDFIFENCS